MMMSHTVVILLIIICNTIPFINSFRLNNFQKYSFINQELKCKTKSISESVLSEYNLEVLYDINNILENKLLISGCYAIEDEKETVQYIGLSDDILYDIEYFKNKLGYEKVNKVRIQTFSSNYDEKFPESYKNELIHQTNPPGNSINSEDWIIPQKNSDIKNVSKFDLLKEKVMMMRSQGLPSLEVETPITPSSETKVLSLHDDSQQLDFTLENVDLVLNEIRPYLISDGGNVSVISIDTKTYTVQLELQGACGNCPSSTTTMKMGVERVLKENFPYITDVEAVSTVVESSKITVDMISNVLGPVMPSISGLGGKISVISIEQETGTVTLKFEGPVRLKKGLELILKEVKEIKHIIFEENK